MATGTHADAMLWSPAEAEDHDWLLSAWGDPPRSQVGSVKHEPRSRRKELCPHVNLSPPR